MVFVEWIKLEIEGGLPENDFVEQIQIKGKKICLIKNEGKLHAVQNDCPHAGGILSGGWCKNGNVVCPIHRWEYSLTTGRGAEGQGDYIHIYPLEMRADGLYIGIKRGWLGRLFKK